jgi:hypothetical protein
VWGAKLRAATGSLLDGKMGSVIFLYKGENNVIETENVQWDGSERCASPDSWPSWFAAPATRLCGGGCPGHPSHAYRSIQRLFYDASLTIIAHVTFE